MDSVHIHKKPQLTALTVCFLKKALLKNGCCVEIRILGLVPPTNELSIDFTNCLTTVVIQGKM